LGAEIGDGIDSFSHLSSFYEESDTLITDRKKNLIL